MRLGIPHLSNGGRHFDDEVIDLTDRLAPYESSVWRTPQQQYCVAAGRPGLSSLIETRLSHAWLDRSPYRTSQGEPAEAEPTEPTLVALDALEPVVEAPGAMEAVLAELVVEELAAVLAELVVEEPDALDAVAPIPPVVEVEEPNTLDAVLAELVREEAEALEAAMTRAVVERSLGTAVSKQARNDPCACGSGRKYKRCCGLRPEAP